MRPFRISSHGIKAGASSAARHQMALLSKTWQLFVCGVRVAAMLHPYFSSAIWWRTTEPPPALTASWKLYTLLKHRLSTNQSECPFPPFLSWNSGNIETVASRESQRCFVTASLANQLCGQAQVGKVVSPVRCPLRLAVSQSEVGKIAVIWRQGCYMPEIPVKMGNFFSLKKFVEKIRKYQFYIWKSSSFLKPSLN